MTLLVARRNGSTKFKTRCNLEKF